MTTPRSPHEDDDFRQLTGAFDRSIAPSPRFAEELKARLEKDVAAQETNAIAARPVSQRTARAGSAQPVRRRKWLDVAIAAALIVAILGGSFWYADVRVGDDAPAVPGATRYAAQPLSTTPTMDAGSDESEAVAFDPGGELDVIMLEDLPPVGGQAVLSGDTLVVAGPFDGEGDERLFAVDLPTGELLWTSDLVVLWDFAVRDGQVVGAFAQPTDSEHTYTMMALSLESGEVLWSGPTVVDFAGGTTAPPPGFTRDQFLPHFIGDAIYHTDQDGEVHALDAATGEVRWTLEGSELIDGQAPVITSQMASSEELLFAIDHQNAIRKIEPESGEVVDRFVLGNRPAPEFLMDLHLQDEVLLAVSITNSQEGTIAFADALSTDDGEMLWSKRLGLAGPGISMTDEIVAIPRSVGMAEIEAGSDLSEPGRYVSFLDLRTGEPLSLYGPSDWSAQWTSASGDVFCINEGMAISCVDMGSETRTMVELPYAPGYELVTPILFWNDTAIVQSANDGVVLLQPKDAQPQQAADPLPGDPGNTNAYAETIDLSQTYSAEPFGGAELGAQEMLVVGDDLVFVGGALTDATNLSIANPTLMSRDVATGEHNWSFQKPGVHLWPQQIATDGQDVYAVLFNPIVPTDTDTQVMGVPVTYHLIALDSETGEVLWEIEQLHKIAGVEPSERYSTGNPLAVGDVVLVPYGPEILIALDSRTGEPVWILAPEEGESLYPEDAYLGGSPVVANGTTAFRGLPDGSVEEIDIETGTARSRIPGPVDQEIITHMTLHLQDDYLVITRDVVPDGADFLSTIDVHNALTGVKVWSVNSSSSLATVTMTTDTLLVTEISNHEPNLLERIIPFVDVLPEIEIMAFDLETGEEVELLRGDEDLTSIPAISADGDTVCMAGETVRCMDLDGNEMVVEGYEVENFMSGNPPVYWNGQIIIGNGMGPLTIAKPGP